MFTTFTEIDNWAAQLPGWEQQALAKVMRGYPFTDADYEELLDLLLEENSLKEKIRPCLDLPFGKSVPTELGSKSGTRKLRRIQDIEYVNALVPGQILEFSDHLTVIFGSNGSGKSGYARILGRAGFTRGDREVLSNVLAPQITNARQRATFVIVEEGAERAIAFDFGSPCPYLAQFYMFDTTSVQAHLTKQNEISFSPPGLSYFAELAKVTDAVRVRLQEQIEKRRKPNVFPEFFVGNSDIKQKITSLNSGTELKSLTKLAEWTQDDEKQGATLELAIAELNAQDVSVELAELEQTVTDLKKLASSLNDTSTVLSDDKIRKLNELIAQLVSAEALSEQASVEQFKVLDIRNIGSQTWVTFLDTARALSELEAKSRERDYPIEGDHCPLCQQPITLESRNLLQRLWAFLEAQSQTNRENTRAALECTRERLKAIDLGFFGEQHAVFRDMLKRNGDLHRWVTEYVATLQARRDSILNAIQSKQQNPVDVLPASPEAAVRMLANAVNQEAEALRAQDTSVKLAELNVKLTYQQHRKVLSQKFTEIQAYVQSLDWIRRASKIGGNTKHITQKHNELFKVLVTDRYITLFEQNLSALCCPAVVKIESKAVKGATYKQVTLKSLTGKADPNKVLSEGEKRAIALADFLTEVELDESSCGIVLDDPVTSLDFEWKEVIARQLAGLSKIKQVVVFTHDLHFLFVIKKHAEEQSVPMRCHWIKRGDQDGKPGYVWLDNSPATEKDYRDPKKAQDYCLRAAKASPEEQQRLISAGFGALRTSYESLVMFEVLGNVVTRFEERISIDRLKDVIAEPVLLQEIIDKVGLLSRYIEGHSHSDAYVGVKPTVKMLDDEIKSFIQLRAEIRRKKNEKKTLV